MKTGHWFAFVVVAILFYWVGTKYPNVFSQLRSAVGA